MGIIKRPHPPEPRDPIVIFKDPSHAGNFDLERSRRLSQPVAVSIYPQTDVPADGAPAFVFFGSEQTPLIWVNDPAPRCIGQLSPTDTQLVSDLIRQLHGGLKATVLLTSEGGQAAIRLDTPSEGEAD